MEFLENITPRKYQEEILKTCVNKNCLVVLPTGLGKTLIALMLTIERIKKFPGEKVVFLAPTRPLVEQHIKSYKKYLPELFAEMQLFTGKIPAKKRQKLWRTSNIIFSTPQCVANDLKKNLYSLENVCLLIEDEAHRCIKNYDYNFIAEKYSSQAQNPRLMGLTASPGSDPEKIKAICKNLFIEEVELRTRDSEDVKEYLQELEFERILLDFPSEFEEIRQILLKIYNQYVEELRLRNVLFGSVNKIKLIEIQKRISATLARGNKNFGYFHAASACAQAIKLQHALELLETQTLFSFDQYIKKLFDEAAKQKSKGVQKLVKKPEFNFVYSASNEMITKGKEHPKLEKLVEIIQKEKEKNKNAKLIVFTQFRDTAATIAKRINELTESKAKVFVGQAKKTSHDGKLKTGLSQKEQRKIINEFSEGEINVLVATSIAEEGLDIPEVNAVIFYEPITSAIRSIQRRGRTARLMKGKLIILITKNTRDQYSHYAARAREKKMKKEIKKIKQELKSSKKPNWLKDKQKNLGEFKENAS